MMDFTLSKEQLIIQNIAKEFVEKHLAPVVEQIEQENAIPESILKAMSELDFFALPYEEKYGGANAGYDGYILVVEQIAKVSRAATAVISAHTLGLGAITKFGTEEQLKKYLGPCCKGEWIASFAFTEPSTGSDPKQITTTAVKDGDGFIINGTKRFISNAVYDGPMVIFAKDAISGKPTAFIIDKFTQGYSISEPWHKMGTRGQKLVDVYFKDLRIPAANLLGELGQGYPILQYGISFGKIGIAANGLGAIGSSLEQSIKYAKERVHRDGVIAKFPTIQTKIADLAIMLEAARWLTYRLGFLANDIKDQTDFIKNAALTKTFVSEMAVKSARLAIEIHGSYGLMEDYKTARDYRDAIFGPLTEGVSDMQKIIVAGILLKD
ncbi:MAG: acyl-CoA dehydrogenase family protein [Syntrophomonadaceae bacterium]|jgi:alkylation response protein AidB-like acyl-CoA dehydrogenase|nr:acyl-CoA dehydrogenase family protein [Syntrophomonadaceae bacterium]